ncbi:MAG: acyl carrier protein [Candidatus Eremiobacteraeota bacterium]|nr:acyl carrier protein [Candidatus Eremiobacteraeota bacterium]
MLDPETAQLIEKGLRELTSRDVGPITSDRRIDELGLDSVSTGELIIVLEDELDLFLDDQELVGLETFGDLGALIQKHKGQ